MTLKQEKEEKKLNMNQLIDTLLHEFHLSLVSGAKVRQVAMNFVDGRREQVENNTNQLAITK